MDTISEDVNSYFLEHTEVWRSLLQGLAERGETVTYSGILSLIPENDEAGMASELMSTAVSYVSSAMNEVRIYQDALNELSSGKNVTSVENRLTNLGFQLSKGNLGRSLVKKIAKLYNNITGVIQKFIASIVKVFNFTLSEIEFTFSIKPQVKIKFVP